MRYLVFLLLIFFSCAKKVHNHIEIENPTDPPSITDVKNYPCTEDNQKDIVLTFYLNRNRDVYDPAKKKFKVGAHQLIHIEPHPRGYIAVLMKLFKQSNKYYSEVKLEHYDKADLIYSLQGFSIIDSADPCFDKIIKIDLIDYNNDPASLEDVDKIEKVQSKERLDVKIYVNGVEQNSGSKICRIYTY